LQVETTIGPRQWPAFEEQVAMAISEKPTLLEATDAKEGIQGSGTRKKSDKEKGRAARGAKAMGKKKEGKKRKKKK